MKARGTTLLLALSVQFMCAQYGSCCFRRWFSPTTTTTPAPTTVSTSPPKCYYEGNVYEVGDLVYERLEGDSIPMCYSGHCRPGGWIDHKLSGNDNCIPRTTLPPRTTPEPTPHVTTTPKITTTPSTTISAGCLYEGIFYLPGEDIPAASGQDGNWCYGAYCSEDGQILSWDNFNCGPSTTTPQTTPETTYPFTTTPLTAIPTTPFTEIPPGMCKYEDKFYQEGEVIDSGQDYTSNWCWTTICGSDGEVLHGDDFNCFGSSAEPSPEPSTPPTTIPAGCLYEGKFYNPGEDIAAASGQDGNWCYGAYCSEDGQILAWDNFNCGPSTTTPQTTPETTYPSTTTALPAITTTPFTEIPPGMCKYEGKFYNPGEDIPEASGQDGNWCYGAYCSEDGQIVPWDNFNCGETTIPQQTTTPSGMCLYNGQYYPQGATIDPTSAPSGDQCWGRFCGDDGDVIVWQNPDCGTSTITTRRYTTTAPGAAECYYKGNYYPEGEHVNDYDICLVCACWSGEMQCGGLWTVPDCEVNGTEPIPTTPIPEPEPECETGTIKTESCHVWMCSDQGLWEAYHFTATEECCMGIERPECETMLDTTLPPKPKTTLP